MVVDQGIDIEVEFNSVGSRDLIVIDSVGERNLIIRFILGQYKAVIFEFSTEFVFVNWYISIRICSC